MTTILVVPVHVQEAGLAHLQINDFEGGQHTAAQFVVRTDKGTFVVNVDYFSTCALVHALTRSLNVFSKPPETAECDGCKGEGFRPADQSFGCPKCNSAGEVPPKGYSLRVSGVDYRFDGTRWRLGTPPQKKGGRKR